MGINNLLQSLKSISRPTHVGKYKGKTVAIDTYCWLHKAAFCCAKELCLGIPTTKYIDYCMHRVRLMQHSGVTPLLVFDGGKLPMKAGEEGTRERSRKEYLEKAQAHLASGNHGAANECWQRAVDISPLMAAKLIQVLKAQGVAYVVAPYEADAQMAHLCLTGQAYAVITEDSDLIPYGCERVLFKMDKFGNGMEIEYKDLNKSRELNFIGFTPEMFLEMCVMAGCDFLPGLSGIGLKKAHALIKRCRSYKKAVKHLRYDGTHVPRGYEEEFQRALWTFKHQRVWCAERGEVVHIREVTEEGLLALEDTDFLGPRIPSEAARSIALGELCPITMEPFSADDLRGAAARVPLAPLPTGARAQRPFFPTASAGAAAGGKGSSLAAEAAKNTLNKYFTTHAAAKKDFKAPRAERPWPRGGAGAGAAGGPLRLSDAPFAGAAGRGLAGRAAPPGRAAAAAAGAVAAAPVRARAGGGAGGELFDGFGLGRAGAPPPPPPRAAARGAAVDVGDLSAEGAGGGEEGPGSPDDMVSPIRRNPLAWNPGAKRPLLRPAGLGPRKVSKFFAQPAEPEPEPAAEEGGGGGAEQEGAEFQGGAEEGVREEEDVGGVPHVPPPPPCSHGGEMGGLRRPAGMPKPDVAGLRTVARDAKAALGRVSAGSSSGRRLDSLSAFLCGAAAGAGRAGAQQATAGMRGRISTGPDLSSFLFKA